MWLSPLAYAMALCVGMRQKVLSSQCFQHELLTCLSSLRYLATWSLWGSHSLNGALINSMWEG